MKRPLFIVGFLIYLTIAAACFFGFNAAFGALMFTAFIFLLLLLFIKKIPLSYIAIVFSILLSLSCFCVYEKLIKQPVELLDGVSCEIEATVLKTPESGGALNSYELKVDKVFGNKSARNFKVITAGVFSKNLNTFDTIKAQVTFKKFENTYTFDKKSYFLSKNIYIYAVMQNEPQLLKSSKNSIGFYLDQNLQQIAYSVKSILPNYHGDVVNAMALGLGNQVGAQIKSSLNQSGLSHVLVVSGFHISLIAGLLCSLLVLFRINSRIIHLLAALLIFLYATFLGYSPSIFRAALMGIIYYIGRAINKEADALNSLGFAVLIVLILSPYSIYDVGFNLSVFSTMGIIVLSAKLELLLAAKLIKGKITNIIFYPILSSLAVTLSALLFTLPISILCIGQISLVAPLSNIAVSIFVPIFTALSLLLSILAPFSFLRPLSNFIGMMCGFFSKIFVFLSNFFASLPYSSVSTDYGFMIIFIISIIILSIVGYLIKKVSKMNVYPVVGVLSLILLFVGILSYNIFNKGVLEITSLNTQNETITVIIEDRSAVIIGRLNDANSGFEVWDYLKSKNVNKIALMILIGEKSNLHGAQVINHRYPIDSIMTNPNLAITQLRLNEKTKQYSLMDGLIRLNSFNLNMKKDDYGYAFYVTMIGNEKLSALLLYDDFDAKSLAIEQTYADMMIINGGKVKNYERLHAKFANFDKVYKNYNFAINLAVRNTDIIRTDFVKKSSFIFRKNSAAVIVK